MIDELIKKISSLSNLSEQEIKLKISEKQAELSDLISDEGAAYIVAKELGVQLIRETERLRIANIIPGMQNVDIVGRIVRISGIREFSTERAKGSVMSIFIADETGTARLSLWNDEIKKAADFSVGDVVRMHGSVKESSFGTEIRLGPFGSINKTDAEIPPLEQLTMEERKYERSRIVDLKENDVKEVRAALMYVFETSPFFVVCPDCGTTIKDNQCKDHGKVDPDYRLVISGIMDDGTANMRVVFFGKNAERILNISKAEAKNIFDAKAMPGLIEKVRLGEDMIFEGRVRKNKYFERLEFIVNTIEPQNIRQEIELLTEQ